MPSTFISTKIATKLLKELLKILKKSRDRRNVELARINDVFGNCQDLAKYYIQPNCQQINPADELEDEAISFIRSKVFTTLEQFFNRDIVTRDGASQMFILADAGMGKTSLLMMLKLSHLSAFWPSDVKCELLKLGPSSIDDINKIVDKTRTVLLLDSLDEDPQCKKGRTEERLVTLLEATTQFMRVIITCRTQFFPKTVEPSFKTLGKITFKNYNCPLIFLSLFNDDQVDLYLDGRYPKSYKHLLTFFRNPKRLEAKHAIDNVGSLQFRPFLLAHIDDLIESCNKGETEYDLYQGLVGAWLDREVIKLRKYHKKDVNKDDLLKACVWLAELMFLNEKLTVSLEDINNICHRESSILMLSETADRVIDGIDNIDIGTNSLLNRNSAGEFRFSHLSIREFLIVYGAKHAILARQFKKFVVTDKIEEFLIGKNFSTHYQFSNRRGGYYLSRMTISSLSDFLDFEMQNATLTYANLSGVDLTGVDLTGVDLTGSVLAVVVLRQANLSQANFTGSVLQGVNLEGADLRGANLTSAFLDEVNLKGADLRGANLTGATLKVVNLEGANLTNANLTGITINEVNLERAELTDANLTGSNFRMADLLNINSERITSRF